MTAKSKTHSADNTTAPTDSFQDTLAQNDNPMPPTLTPNRSDNVENTLSPEDRALLLQLTNGLEQRSATTPFASETVLHQITGQSLNTVIDKSRRRRRVGLTVALAGLAATPFVVRPAITALRGKEQPVKVSTSSSAMPKFIVGGLEEEEIMHAFVFSPIDKGMSGPTGSKLVRLRKGNASIDIATYGGTFDYRTTDEKNAVVTPVQIGAVTGKRVVLPSNKPTKSYEWSLPEGQLSASAQAVSEPELLTILASVTRTQFSSDRETSIAIGDQRGFIRVGESSDKEWGYSVNYGPKRKFTFFVEPTDILLEDTFARANKTTSPAGRQYAVDGPDGRRSYLTWIDLSGVQISFGVSYSDQKDFENSKPLTDEQFNELMKLADSVRQVDDETFAKVVTSHSFMSNSPSKIPKKAPMANVLDGTIDGVAWKLTAGETPLEKECQKITFSGPSKPFNDCISANPKDEFVSLGAANVGSANPRTVVFGVVKDTVEIIRVRNSAGDVIGEDFSIENSYLDGRAFAIELPNSVTGELTIEGYSYDDDVADSIPETQFLPNDAKPLATKTVTVK